MLVRRLGRSGLKVSALSLGSWTTYGGSVDEAAATPHRPPRLRARHPHLRHRRRLRRGEAERVLGKALRRPAARAGRHRHQVHGPRVGRPARARGSRASTSSTPATRACAASASTTSTSTSSTRPTRTRRSRRRCARSRTSCARARCATSGYSNFDHHPPLDRQVLELQQKRGWDVMVSSQPRWSLLDRRIEKAHVPLCRKWGVGLLVYSPLAQGVLTNKYAGGATPEGSRAASKFAHFLTQEKALTPENVAAAERLAAWCAKSRRGHAGAGRAGLGAAPSRGVERDHRRDQRGADRREREGLRARAVGRAVARGRGGDRRAGQGPGEGGEARGDRGEGYGEAIADSARRARSWASPALICAWS